MPYLGGIVTAKQQSAYVTYDYKQYLLIALPSFHLIILICDPSRFAASVFMGSFRACRSARAAMTEY